MERIFDTHSNVNEFQKKPDSGYIPCAPFIGCYRKGKNDGDGTQISGYQGLGVGGEIVFKGARGTSRGEGSRTVLYLDRGQNLQNRMLRILP